MLFLLSEELGLIRVCVETFTRAHITPRAAAIENGNKVLRDLRPKRGELFEEIR